VETTPRTSSFTDDLREYSEGGGCTALRPMDWYTDGDTGECDIASIAPDARRCDGGR
jgi:hypothetical protein